MEIKHLKTLMMVASTRSISKASNQLHLSQPSVTRIIQEIESIVGVPLFSRTKNGMVLTGAGKNFYTQATRIVSTLHDVVAELKAPYESNIINIGFCPSVLIFDFIEQLRYSNYRMDYIRFHELSEKALPGFPWVADLLMSFPEGTNEGYGPIFSDSRADRALVC